MSVTEDFLPKELQLVYADRRYAEYKPLLNAASNHDFQHIAQVCHQWKGNARSYGFLDLEEIAIQLEKSALAEDLNSTMGLIKKFETWLEVQKNRP